MGTSTRGFASMTPERRREIASKGGKAVPKEARYFARNRETATKAGRKGGMRDTPSDAQVKVLAQVYSATHLGGSLALEGADRDMARVLAEIGWVVLVPGPGEDNAYAVTANGTQALKRRGIA